MLLCPQLCCLQRSQPGCRRQPSRSPRFDGPRIALLPVSVLSFALIAFAGAAASGLARAGLSLTPVWLLTLIVLPWLPVPVPAALLMWSGSIRWLVWTAVLLLILAPVTSNLRRRLAPTAIGALVATRPTSTAGLLAFSIFLFPRGRSVRRSRAATSRTTWSSPRAFCSIAI